MTTVAAIARDGIVHMAADSECNVYERPVSGGVTKIVRLPILNASPAEDILLGFSGVAGLPGVIAADLVVPNPPRRADADPQPWATSVARAITTIAAATGLLSDGRMDAHLILGWGGRVWSINHMLAVAHPDGIAAIGSGEGPAIGAIDAHLANGAPPSRALTMALNIAIARDRYSSHPVQMETLTTAAEEAPTPRYQPPAAGPTATLAAPRVTIDVDDRTRNDLLSPAQHAGMVEHSRRTHRLRQGMPGLA